MFIKFNPNRRHTPNLFSPDLFRVTKETNNLLIEWMCKRDSGKVIRKTYISKAGIPTELLPDGYWCVKAMKLYNGKWVFDRKNSKTKEDVLKIESSPIVQWMRGLEGLYHDIIPKV